jgi:hypothetical protein
MKIELTGDDKQKVKLINYLNRNKIDFSHIVELESQLVTTEEITIDFTTKKTELGWIQLLDRTAINYVPKWFNFLNWVVILGLLNYLSSTSNDWKVKLIYALSMIGLFIYLQGYFYSIKFIGFPVIRNEKFKVLISSFISGIFLYMAYYFIDGVIPIFRN